MLMLAIIFLLYLTFQTPLVAAISVLSFHAALFLRRTGDEPFAMAVRQPRNKSKPKHWLIAYAVACAMAGTTLFFLRPWSRDPDASLTGLAPTLYSSTIALHGGFFFAYMGWTGTQLSRLVYWLLGFVVVAFFGYIAFW